MRGKTHVKKLRWFQTEAALQVFQNMHGYQMQLNHVTGEVSVGGQQCASSAHKQEVDWARWHKTVDAGEMLKGGEPRDWKSPSDWGDGTFDLGPLHAWPEEAMQYYAAGKKTYNRGFEEAVPQRCAAHELKLELWDVLLRNGEMSLHLTDSACFDGQGCCVGHLSVSTGVDRSRQCISLKHVRLSRWPMSMSQALTHADTYQNAIAGGAWTS